MACSFACLRPAEILLRRSYPILPNPTEEILITPTHTEGILPNPTEELLHALGGTGTRHDETAVLVLDDAEDVLGGFEDAEEGEYIRALLDSKVLYGSWCCSRTNFHHPGATAFFTPPPKLPVGAAATRAREQRAW